MSKYKKKKIFINNVCKCTELSICVQVCMYTYTKIHMSV